MVKNKQAELSVLIMAGGSGTRLWPLSRNSFPKQFLELENEKSLLKLTLERIEELNPKSIFVICNYDHRFLVAQELQDSRQSDKIKIILEPVGRNTAPAVGFAALCTDPSDKLLVLPSDHLIQDKLQFLETVGKAFVLAEKGKLITFGVVPTDANTGYGYIKKGASFLSGFQIDEFVEKPELNKAIEYHDSGEYLWNSGIFLFQAETYLSELKKYRSDISDNLFTAFQNNLSDSDFIRIPKKDFESCPSDSIDYAVMEHTNNGLVLPLDCGWNDVGSWKSLWEVSIGKDDRGNSCTGEIITSNVSDSILHSEDNLLVAVNVEDLVIAVTKDAVLVADKNKPEEIKKAVDTLRELNREEADHHRRVHRPWGSYDSISRGKGFQVKRITVLPGATLSLQSHKKRAEHWVVVKGNAIVTKGDSVFKLSTNESVYIPIGIKHRLENPGKEVLEIVEVQIGSYLGEDDIIRYSDKYGRE